MRLLDEPPRDDEEGDGPEGAANDGREADEEDDEGTEEAAGKAEC